MVRAAAIYLVTLRANGERDWTACLVLTGVTLATIGTSRLSWAMAIAGAALSTAAYAIAIWAMTVAPIALVAALRETSGLFAALLGMVLLREPVLPARIAAACLVVAEDRARP